MQRGRGAGRWWVWSAAIGALVGAGSAAGQSLENELDCLIEPRRSVVLSAPVPGVVESILVDRGDRVEEGQVLATLESSVERATVAAAKVRAEAVAELRSSEARDDFERLRLEQSQQLYEQGVVSDIEYGERKSAALVAEATVLRARENMELARLDLARSTAVLERRTIRSPFNGVVVERKRQPGEYADEPPEIIELAEIDPLRVELYAPVSMLGRISVGSRARVRSEAGDERDAAVVVVDRVVNPGSGTFGVALEFPNPDHDVAAGLKCTVRFAPDEVGG
jgi:RND family efflux transporter MFP subunit